MENLRRLTGKGTLRLAGMKAVAAEYWLFIGRRRTGPQAGEIYITGQVQADMTALVSADGRAWLTLEGGTTHQVSMNHLTATIAEIHVLPPFDGLLD